MKKFLLAVAAMATIATASAADYYMTGAFNGWNGWEKLTENEGKYEISMANLKSEFLLSDYQGYDADAANGYKGKIGAAEGVQITLGEAANCAFGGKNLTFAGDVLEVNNAKVVFDPTAMTVTVTGDVNADLPGLWVVGAAIGAPLPEGKDNWWNMDTDTNKMTEANGVYTYTGEFLDGSATALDFKIAGQGWNPQVGPSEAVAALDTDYACADLGQNNSKWGLAAGKYTLTYNYAAKTLKVTTAGEGGIEAIEADAELPAVYYNLQGVRVNNPENGVFVMVRGNKAVKVVK